MKGYNKAQKAKRYANFDIYESQYLDGGHRMKKDAKRSSRRAQRRLDKTMEKDASTNK